MNHLLNEIAQRSFPDDHDEWPAIQARLDQRRRQLVARRWVLSSACALMGFVLLAATLVVTSRPETVSAESLLDRAGTISDGAATSVHSYHVVATVTLGLAANREAAPIVQHEETWFGGNGRVRQATQADAWSTLIVSDGTHTWWQVARGASTYVAPADGIRLSDAAYLNPLSESNANIASVIQFLTKSGCGQYGLAPDQTVAGRAAYVVRVTHTLAGSCWNPVQTLAQPRPSPVAASGAGPSKAPPARTDGSAKDSARVVAAPSPSAGQAIIEKPAGASVEAQQVLNSSVVDTFWIDKETFVPLKAVQSLGPKGSSTYEVSSVEYNVALSDSLFQYTPPPGAQQLADAAAIKQRLATQVH
ncbi:MAG: hypothetical protein JO020_15910 [Chloroflexi bacterium]|nr:hypothetical protein [Chloroflexota bacterium]